MPDAADVAYRDLTFADRADGAVVVRDARDGRLVEVLPAASDGFVRGVLRSLVRERRLRGLGDEAPFRLARRGDGRLALEDRASGAEVVLNAFGATNVEAFARFLNAEGERR
jgi:putative photosynthetic complex assembly protein